MSLPPVLSDPAYRIEAELGSGGGSVVYKAWHTRLQKYVVLKRIKDESGLIQSGLERAEVDILKNLKHTYLPQLYDFLNDPSGVYTVMEFIPGRSFADLLKERRRFEQKEVIRWALQLSEALAYLHGQNPTVLHSDIKPANIMLTPEGELCLIDFNISLVLDGEDTKAIGLSHGYASPEQYGPPGLAAKTNRVPGESASRSGSQLPDGATPAVTELDNRYSADPRGGGHYPGSSAPAVTELDNRYSDDPSVTDISTGNTTDLRVTHLGGRVAPAPQPPQRRQDSSSVERREKIRMDARSDIYSFGATMYHMVTGERPEIATGNYKPLSRYGNIALSEAFVYIIERCMERDPAKRFQSASDLHDAIANIHKLDNRWKRQRVKTIAAIVVLMTCLIAFSAATVLGGMLMGSEKIEKYNMLVIDISSDAGDGAYEGAIELFPEKPDAYREQALKLYMSGSFEECVEYVKIAMAKLSAYSHDADALRMIGDIYYAQANAYFELERFQDSLPAYEAAIGNNPGNPEMFRDFAIALARCGYVDKAEELLNEVSGNNIGSDSINLLKGEIAYAKGDDEQAIQFFATVISETDDPQIRNRAYIISALAYPRAPKLIRGEITLLRNALLDLPDNYKLFIKEKLAGALVRADEYAEAAALYDELRLSGNISYHTWQNIGVLYQQMGDLAGARKVYLELAEAYPGDYRPPMRLAFLTLEEQAALDIEERDYAQAVQWHTKARELYGKRPQSASDDMEMLMLDNLVNELRQNGWID